MTPADLAKELSDFKDRHGFTQLEVAEALLISERYVRKILAGEKIMNWLFIVGAIEYYENHMGAKNGNQRR